MVERGTFEIGAPTTGGQASGNAALDVPLPDEYRVLTMTLYISGGGASFGTGSRATLAANANLIESLLRDAARAYGPYGVGQAPALCYAEQGAKRLLYFDVITGTLVRDKTEYTNVVRKYTLTLYCYPDARGDSYTTPTYVVSDASNPSFIVPGVPGDVDALARMVLADTSPNTSATLTGLYLGRRSYRTQAASDFSGFIKATTGSDRTGGPAAGAPFADATAFGGQTVRFNAFPVQTVQAAIFPGPSGALVHGLFDVLLRVRDSTPRLLAPQVSVASFSGSPNGQTVLWIVTCCAVNTAGYLGPPSAPFYVLVDAGLSVSFTLAQSAQGGETPAASFGYRLFASTVNYSSGVASGWKSQAFNAGSAVNIGPTLTGFTAGLPPAYGSSEPLNTTYLTPMTYLLPFSWAGAWQSDVVFGPTVQPLVGNGVWELLKAGTLSGPPQTRLGSMADQPFVFSFAAQSGNGATANVDFDAIYLLPHGDEDQLVLLVNTPNQPPQQTWVAETRQDGRTSALLYLPNLGIYTPAPGTVTSYGGLESFVQANGRMTLGPGDNRVIIAPLASGSGPANFYPLTSNVQTTFTVYFDVTPRYRDVAGVLSGVWQ